jgi:hypothetical protein
MTDSTDNARGRIAHPFNGPDLPTEVFADPGRRGWYFREKMPDSVARFVRADLAPDPQDARVAALRDAARRLLDGQGFTSDGNDAWREVSADGLAELAAALAAFDTNKGGKNE